MSNISYEEKMNMIRQRYRSTKDLWLYMTERCKYSLPLLTLFTRWLFDAFVEELQIETHLRHLGQEKEGLVAG